MANCYATDQTLYGHVQWRPFPVLGTDTNGTMVTIS